MKGCILKPIIWNTNNYTSPSGYPCQSGYPKLHGFGHEEWNNAPRMEWRGWRVFHTELREKLRNYSQNGELLIIMTALNPQGQFALGIAAGVHHNTDEEMKTVAGELGLLDRESELWNLPVVQEKFGTKKALSSFWKDNYHYIQWRCPKEYYHWFDQPIRLNPRAISGKNSLVFMYSSYQAVPPATISNIIEGTLPTQHPIWTWLAEGEYDPDFVSKPIQNLKGKPKPSSTLKQKRKGRNSSPQNAFEYWVQGKRTAEPHHAFLQAKYISFLRDKKIKPIEDQDYIDVQYIDTSGALVFVEIKPTVNIETKYAIRAAIGQLMEYRFINNKSAQLNIVIGSKPKKVEADFVKSLGITLTYLDSDSKTFEEA